MEKNTAEDTVSSIPSFMTDVSAKVEAAKSDAERKVEAEENAQDLDELAAREASIEKAITRLTELADYCGRVATVSEKLVPTLIAKHSLGTALDMFTRFEDSVTAVENQYKRLKGIIDKSREVSFPTRLDAEETQTASSSATGNRITRTARVFASIIKEQQDAAYKWLRDNELGEIIKETVNSSSLSGAAKEAMENGKEMPEDLFRVHMKDGVSITRGKKKG